MNNYDKICFPLHFEGVDVKCNNKFYSTLSSVLNSVDDQMSLNVCNSEKSYIRNVLMISKSRDRAWKAPLKISNKPSERTLDTLNGVH